MQARSQTADTSFSSLTQRDVHIALWAILLLHSIIAKIGLYPTNEWFSALTSTSLMVVCAFIVIFHLLTDTRSSAPCEQWDFWIFGGTVTLLTISGLFGTPYDVALVMGLLSLYYFSKFSRVPNSYFIGFVYLALAFNGFFAPLIFHLLKDTILIGEVHIAAVLNNIVGFNIDVNGTRLTAESGMRLQMIGACSVYSNLSLAVLGYASVKAFFKQIMMSKDIIILLALSIGLVIVNSIRIGLMTPGVSSYEYWHHGNGGMIVGIIQTVMIIAVCTSSTVFLRRV